MGDVVEERPEQDERAEASRGAFHEHLVPAQEVRAKVKPGLREHDEPDERVEDEKREDASEIREPEDAAD